MIRAVVVQSITAVQNAHDLRVCDLIRALRAGGCIDTEAVINQLIQLRCDMLADSNKFKKIAQGDG
jgi:hypothetical protein